MFSNHLAFLEEGDFKGVGEFYDFYRLEEKERTEVELSSQLLIH